MWIIGMGKYVVQFYVGVDFVVYLVEYFEDSLLIEDYIGVVLFGVIYLWLCGKGQFDVWFFGECYFVGGCVIDGG